MLLSSVELTSGDWVAIGSILVTVILSTTVVVLQNSNRTQKDFFIKEVDELKSDYISFIQDIKSNNLNAESIRDGFRSFSGRIRMLDELLSREYVLKKNDVFDCHGVFQQQITGLQSIEDQYSSPTVHLSGEERTRLDDGLQPVHKSLIELIISINKAKKTAPWLVDEDLQY